MPQCLFSGLMNELRMNLIEFSKTRIPPWVNKEQCRLFGVVPKIKGVNLVNPQERGEYPRKLVHPPYLFV